jgi:hypothetical protein
MNGEVGKRILDKLARVREQKIETFGSSTHEYALAPPLDEAAVCSLEQQLGVGLPDAYRWFLRNLGASGAGPYYGIVPPKRWDSAEPSQGMITIAEQGCAYYAMLVTAGPERGRIAYISMDGGKPFLTEDADFIAWYERWLDELLAGFKHFWFGTQMPGTEASFAAAARPADGARRLDALCAMRQLRSLEPETREVVALRVRDADAQVRTAALQLVKQFGLAGVLESHVRRALEDVAPSVRAAALEALVAAELAWHDPARRALGDPDEHVVTVALRALEAARALTEDDVVPLLDSPHRSVRTTAQWAGRTIRSARIFDLTLDRLRSDGDDEYRSLLQSLTAQARLGALDEARSTALFEQARERVASSGSEHETAAVTALGALARSRDDAFAVLLETTRHAAPFLRWDAARVLGELGRRDALPALRALASDTAMPRAKSVSTAWSVGQNARMAIEKIEAKRD